MTFIGDPAISTLALFGLPGYMEVIIVLLAILLLFGGKKLPELARGLGKGITEFKKGLKGVKDEIDTAANEDDEKTEDS